MEAAGNCTKFKASWRSIATIGLPVTALVAAGVLAAQPELRLAVPLLIGMTALMATVLALALYGGGEQRLEWSPQLILAVALLLRLMFLLGPPQLSDDLYRYVWDGSNLLRGVNPYTAAPAGVKPPPDLALVHARINHPQYVTIYPPAAQLIFAGGASLNVGVTGLKALLLLFDLGLCALLIKLLQRLRMPVWRGVLYAWNPLPVIEIAGSGHVDGAGLTLLSCSIWLLTVELQRTATPRRWPYLLSGAAYASAVLVKLFPLLLAPVLLLLVPRGRRRHFSTAVSVSLAALLLPFLPHLANMTASLATYGRNWEFAGFAFTTLRAATGSGMIARLLLAFALLLAVGGIVLRLAGSIKRGLTAADQTLQGLQACYAIAMALLLLTPTLQPWYALCLALFLPFCAGPAGLILCWAVFLTYQVQIAYFTSGKWLENPAVTAAVFLAPTAAYLLGRAFARKQHSPALP